MTHCRRCNRVLKNPVAVKNGIGLVCARKEQIDNALKRNDSDTDQIVPYDGGNIWIERQFAKTLNADQKIENAVDRYIYTQHYASGIKTNVQRSLYKHSPAGFNFGYGGSGPADLALNICRMFSPEPDTVQPDFYQRFKERFCTSQGDENGRLEIPIIEIENFFRQNDRTFKNPAIFAQQKLFLI